jgi:hypothetical protein
MENLILGRLRKLISPATAKTGGKNQAANRRKLLRAVEIRGFLIGYEKGGGQTFAFGHCPYCGEKFETVQVEMDAGLPTTEKLSAHIAEKHNSGWNIASAVL